MVSFHRCNSLKLISKKNNTQHFTQEFYGLCIPKLEICCERTCRARTSEAKCKYRYEPPRYFIITGILGQRSLHFVSFTPLPAAAVSEFSSQASILAHNLINTSLVFITYTMGSFMSSNYDENVHVIVVGGGYAGMAAAKALDANVRVTLIESTDSFNHKIASLRAAVVPGWERRIRVPVDNQLKNGKLIQADVKAVDTGRVTLTDESVLECDYVVLAHGKGSLNFPSGEVLLTMAYPVFRSLTC